jgi:hypothetical protein
MLLVRAITAEVRGEPIPAAAARALKNAVAVAQQGLLTAKEEDQRDRDKTFVAAVRDVYEAVDARAGLRWDRDRSELDSWLYPWRRYRTQEDALAYIFDLDKVDDAVLLSKLKRSRAAIARPAIPSELGTTGAQEHAMHAVRIVRDAPSRRTLYAAETPGGAARAARRRALRHWMYRPTEEDLREFLEMVNCPPFNEDFDELAREEFENGRTGQ